MMINSKRILTILAIALLPAILTSGCMTTQNKVPSDSDGVRKLVRSGSLFVSGRSYALIISGAWSAGTLKYRGKKYLIKAKAIGIGYSLGVKNIEITGTVYNLKRLSDINGTYIGVNAGATLGKGIGASNVTNKKDVVLGLTTRSQGVAVDIAAGVTSMTVKLVSTHPVK